MVISVFILAFPGCSSIDCGGVVVVDEFEAGVRVMTYEPTGTTITYKSVIYEMAEPGEQANSYSCEDVQRSGATLPGYRMTVQYCGLSVVNATTEADVVARGTLQLTSEDTFELPKFTATYFKVTSPQVEGEYYRFLKLEKTLPDPSIRAYPQSFLPPGSQAEFRELCFFTEEN